jgi:hypothetical protein
MWIVSKFDRQLNHISFARVMNRHDVLCVPLTFHLPLLRWQPKANLPDPSAFLESFLSGLLKGNVSRPSEIIETRVRDKVVLLDNPTIGKSRRDRDAQARAVRSLKHMSLREHRRNRSFDIPPELQR